MQRDRECCFLWGFIYPVMNQQKHSASDFCSLLENVHFVQKVFLFSNNIGFLIFFTVYWLYYSAVENSQLNFELCLLQYICVYIPMDILTKHKLLVSLQNKQARSAFYCERLTHSRTCNLIFLPKPSTNIQVYRKYCYHFLHGELKTPNTLP